MFRYKGHCVFWLHNFFFAKELLQDWILFLFKFFLNWKKIPPFFERGDDGWDVLKLTKKNSKNYFGIFFPPVLLNSIQGMHDFTFRF